MQVLWSIADFFRSLFAAREDDFKTLLLADLGIER